MDSEKKWTDEDVIEFMTLATTKFVMIALAKDRLSSIEIAKRATKLEEEHRAILTDTFDLFKEEVRLPAKNHKR